MPCRSQTKLSMLFSDLFSVSLKNQGVSKCLSLVATIKFGKANQHGKIQYGACARHHDLEVCPVRDLAMSLFSRFNFEDEAFADFNRRSNWYKTCAVKGDSPFKPVAYSTLHKLYKEAFTQAR